ncbi:MAG TPA: phage holin family protein [Verrucomicrobiae bacterium]|nr:phage holin family protein [Verrucomicrobiae bacterium]
MQTPQDFSPHLAEASKRVAQRLLVICENRIHLLMVELEEERERFMGALIIAFAAMVLGTLSMFTLTAIIVIAFWHWSPLIVLAILTVVYGGISGLLYVRLARWQRDWRLLAGTLEQIKKDRECLANLV